MPPSRADYKVELVGPGGAPDMTVAVVGDQVVNLAGGTPGDVLTLQPDGTVAPAAPAGGGAVDSVNGQTGVVVLNAAHVGADVSGAAAAAQAASQPVNANLTAIAAVANQTAFGRALLAMADASALQTAAGLSAFVKTLMDDADASAFLTTLGMSTFFKTLVDDADGSAVLTTLGVSTFAKTVLDDASAAAMLGTLGFATIRVTLTDETTSGTAEEQWGTEEAVLAQASSPANATVKAFLQGWAEDIDANQFGGARVQISLDGGSTWGGGQQSIVSSGINIDPSARIPFYASYARSGAVTGDIQARATFETPAAAGAILAKGGSIIMDVRPATGLDSLP